MKLLPSLKQKKRYVLFEIKPMSAEKDKMFSFTDVQQEVDHALLLFLGKLGLAKAVPLLVKEQYGENKLTIKVNHQYVDEVKSALLFIKSIKNSPVIVRSITTSGTLKKLKKAGEVP
ncbi:MAG TPA: Rpp14/Pop5 family protein [Candidatus Nanoarchaeia archaeon]|nr:Rpp14/Pop5 family protein [Candidatus Nanoarchaeia archaeon]